MMGFKARLFAPQPNVTLNDLVPADHFYRHLDRTLDLSFVRDLVRDCYAPLGWPSIDPIVFFKLHLVQFFETIVARCQAAGLVVGQALDADGNLVEADADRDAMVPRFALEA